MLVSLYGGGGITAALLSAMAAGAVPIASKASDVAPWLEHGVTALLVDPDDPRAVAAAILRYVRDREWSRTAAAANVLSAEVQLAESHLLKRAEAFYGSMVSGAGP